MFYWLSEVDSGIIDPISALTIVKYSDNTVIMVTALYSDNTVTMVTALYTLVGIFIVVGIK